MDAFWLSLVMIFLAELGDKTQLVAMTLATRFNARTVLLGIFFATLAIHVVSAGLGVWMGGWMPTDWIHLLAGIAFVGFGFWTLRGDCLEEGECERSIASPFWMVFVTFFLAELGDKTMLSTVALAATHPFLPVWIGSTLGMVISDGLAILVGQALGTRLPERAVKIGAAVIFFGFGLFSGVQGAMKLPVYSWAISMGIIAVLAYLFIGRRKKKELQDQITQIADKKAS